MSTAYIPIPVAEREQSKPMTNNNMDDTEEAKAITQKKADEVMRPKAKLAKVKDKLRARRDELTRPPFLNIEHSEEGKPRIMFGGEQITEEHLYLIDAMGLGEPASSHMLLDQLTRLYDGDFNRMDDSRINRALFMLAELKPDGGDEAMLCAQMVATHIAAMDCMQRVLLEGQTFEGRELNLKYGTKLLQAYTQQFAALDKKRRGGQQKVVVKHVHVNEGGQAIVGDVSTRGGG